MNMAESLNLGCLCATLQPQLLARQFERPGFPSLENGWTESRPHLFSATPVFLSDRDYLDIQQGVAALHRTAALPAYQDCALERSSDIALHAFGPQGAFMGYDFHIGADGPRLIEINTNAGGALLHAAAARAHRGCCTPVDALFGTPTNLDHLDETFVDMFRSEWRLQRGDAPLRSVAIVDDSPGGQYLAPEFELARQLFVSHGIHAVIADPGELQWRGDALWHSGLPADMPVDLVYNRLTDFDLSAPSHDALRIAYLTGKAVVTPHPRAHALHADKRNLISLSNDALLATWGVPELDRALISRIVPRTQLVTADNAEALWSQRKQLFFKPVAGYGSKAAYRGDKLTRRVWAEIAAGGFVAQALVAPSERSVRVNGEPARLKLDVRAYAYNGKIQLLAARTYSGQTTNFRTPGGGFSPIVVLPFSGEQVAEPCAC